MPVLESAPFENMNYINFSPEPGAEISIGFDTAEEAEKFLASQSPHLEWQAQWRIERIFAYGKFHWITTTNKYVTINFPKL